MSEEGRNELGQFAKGNAGFKPKGATTGFLAHIDAMLGEDFTDPTDEELKSWPIKKKYAYDLVQAATNPNCMADPANWPVLFKELLKRIAPVNQPRKHTVQIDVPENLFRESTDGASLPEMVRYHAKLLGRSRKNDDVLDVIALDKDGYAALKAATTKELEESE